MPARHAPAPLVALSLAALLPSLGTGIANVVLPTLASAFEASFAEVQWVVVAYLLAVTALVVGAGQLGDRLGRRRVLLAGLGLFSVASAAAAFATSLWFLIAARAFQGAGAAVAMALSFALVADVIPRDRVGRALGLLGTMSAVGTTLGPSIGGALVAWFGWQAVFAAMAGAGTLAFFAGRRLYPAGPPRDPALAGAGRALRLDVLRDRSLVSRLVSLGIVTAILMATLVVGPFYLSFAGLDPATIGLVMTIGPAVAAATGVPAGGLVDRIGWFAGAGVGLVGVVAGAILMVILPGQFGVGGYAGALALIAAGYALFQAANNTSIVRRVPPADRGVAAGLLGLSRNLGLVAGASAMAALFAAGSNGLAWLPPGAHSGLQVTFAAAAVLGGLCLVLLSLERAR